MNADGTATKDLNSYWAERAKGQDSHNIVTFAMNQFRFYLQETLDWLSGYTNNTVDGSLSTLASLPS